MIINFPLSGRPPAHAIEAELKQLRDIAARASNKKAIAALIRSAKTPLSQSRAVSSYILHGGKLSAQRGAPAEKAGP